MDGGNGSQGRPLLQNSQSGDNRTTSDKQRSRYSMKIKFTRAAFRRDTRKDVESCRARTSSEEDLALADILAAKVQWLDTTVQPSKNQEPYKEYTKGFLSRAPRLKSTSRFVILRLTIAFNAFNAFNAFKRSPSVLLQAEVCISLPQ